MTVETYNIKGEKSGEAELPERIFHAPWKPVLVKQVFDGEQANKRHPWAHTKGRGEVSGGGIKPWRQKGTGRARHGSTRSPIWRHGGVSHGPITERSFEVKINKKMKRLAFFSVLSKKLKEKEVVFLDQFSLAAPKTKEALSVFKNLRDKASIYRLAQKGGRAVVAFPKNDVSSRSLRNLPFVEYIEPRNLNTSALLKNKYVVLDKSSIEELNKTYAK
ncbi:MAG: 50S ribosomal protein L4 [Patescibacteria group bacterium]